VKLDRATLETLPNVLLGEHMDGRRHWNWAKALATRNRKVAEHPFKVLYQASSASA